MRKSEIIKGNKLIAEFMGIECKKFDDNTLVKIPFDIEEPVFISYHSSWDQLMPVVDKIEDMGWIVSIQKGYCEIFPEEPLVDDEFSNKSDTLKIKKIELCFQTVVEFIEWEKIGRI